MTPVYNHTGQVIWLHRGIPVGANGPVELDAWVLGLAATKEALASGALKLTPPEPPVVLAIQTAEVSLERKARGRR